MGHHFQLWQQLAGEIPQHIDEAVSMIRGNRSFTDIDKLDYGSQHLDPVIEVMDDAIRSGKRIALYADYDVDGTMSCVSWIWFFRHVGFENFVHYIPCRFSEGYGVNMAAVKHLIDDVGADVIITMDTGITANDEAAYARQRGVAFICTDHHKIQPQKMPDCLIVNPKMHPDPLYQELCGCGITFVLLRKLAQRYQVKPELWLDLLALAGMATICDVVPMNGVNHRLARMGIEALAKSRRPILQKLLRATQSDEGADEKDIGFRLGPRINAVGRLNHADKIVEAFVNEDPEQLIVYMTQCNDQRKKIQQEIYQEARQQAVQFNDDPILFLGGAWHSGVVGIVASRLAEEFWRPVWLYNNSEAMHKGSARSIAGFDVTAAMMHAGEWFTKFGGHQAAGGFSFEAQKTADLHRALLDYSSRLRSAQPQLWQSRIDYDFQLPEELLDLEFAEALSELKPFGHGFSEPKFLMELPIAQVQYYQDKLTGAPKHTAVAVEVGGRREKIMFFNQVCKDLSQGKRARFIVGVSQQVFRGRLQLNLSGIDYEPIRH